MDTRDAPDGFDPRLPDQPACDDDAGRRRGAIIVGKIEETQKRAAMNLLRRTVWAGWTRLARLASRSYLAGAELEDALRVCRRFSERSFATSVCYWNGAGDEPRLIADHYLAALDALGREDLNGYLSIKAPALGFNRALVAEITERAEHANIR